MVMLTANLTCARCGTSSMVVDDYHLDGRPIHKCLSCGYPESGNIVPTYSDRMCGDPRTRDQLQFGRRDSTSARKS